MVNPPPHPSPRASPQWPASASPAPSTPASHDAWSDSSARAVLQLITDSVAEMTGFEVAALSVVVDDQLVTVAYTGPEELREFLSEPDPVSIVEPIVRDAEVWGRFRFLAEERQTGPLPGHWAVTSERGEAQVDAWSPVDALVALLTDDDGRLVGMLSVDRPTSGRRPHARRRDLLEKYAAQTERAVITAFEREALVRQVAHAETARRLIRAASLPAHLSLADVLSSTHRPLVEGFGSAGSWIQVFDHVDPRRGGVGYARARSGRVVHLPDRLVALTQDVAPHLWAEQRVLVVDERLLTDGPRRRALGGALLDAGAAQMREHGVATALGVPLGAGTECVGFLVLTRGEGDPAWSSVEIDSAREIGHDLGAALLAARALERERTLVRELQQLDDHRNQLITTLSHELRTPLSVIAGNLELLGDLPLDGVAARLQEAMTRGATRMQRMVDDLLLLARVSDPRHPLVVAPVDLHLVADDVLALVASAASAKGVTLHAELEPVPLVVPGDTAEIDRLVANLVSNAVKFTPSHGTVTVSARRDGDHVVLQVRDTGIGISDDDQAGLFRAFFRTTNPDALREPGTGLGLNIVATVAARHHGTVEVTSRLGEGTAFTVRLPLLDEAAGAAERVS